MAAIVTLGALFATAAQAETNPWFGTWSLRLQAPGERPETLIYSDAGHGAMRMESVEEGSVLITRFDGRPAINVRRRATGQWLAVSATSPTSYTWTFSKRGKPFVRGRNTLAPDRRSFVEVSWPVSDPSDVVTLVYDRR